MLYIPLHIRVFTTALAWFSNSAILQSIEDLFKYYKCIRFYVCLNASWLSQPHLPKVITLFYKTQVDAFDEMQPNLSFCYRPAAQTTRWFTLTVANLMCALPKGTSNEKLLCWKPATASSSFVRTKALVA